MALIDARHFAMALAIGAALVVGNPTAAAADEPDETPGLTVGGRPLAELLRTEPTAPFLAFESSPAGARMQSERVGSAVQPGKQRGSKAKRALIGGAIGGGIGAFLGYSACANESGRNCPYSSYGGLVGVGIGAAIGLLVGM